MVVKSTGVNPFAGSLTYYMYSSYEMQLEQLDLFRFVIASCRMLQQHKASVVQSGPSEQPPTTIHQRYTTHGLNMSEISGTKYTSQFMIENLSTLEQAGRMRCIV